MKLAKPDEDFLLDERKTEEAELIAKLVDLFGHLDFNNNGKISIHELKRASTDSRMRHKFELLGVNLRDDETFFSTISVFAEDGMLNEETFISAWMKMQGPASSLDLHAMRVHLQDAYGRTRSKGS